MKTVKDYQKIARESLQKHPAMKRLNDLELTAMAVRGLPQWEGETLNQWLDTLIATICEDYEERIAEYKPAVITQLNLTEAGQLTAEVEIPFENVVIEYKALTK